MCTLYSPYPTRVTPKAQRFPRRPHPLRCPRPYMDMKGMVAIDGQDNPRATREFEADVVILHHSTTVAPGYQPVIHCGVVRQAAAILSMSGTESGMEALRTGQTATVRFRFMVRERGVPVSRVLVCVSWNLHVRHPADQ